MMNRDDCKQPAGITVPLIDRERCEGKEDCVAVCPYSVFEVRKLEKSERAQLSLKGRIKAFVHGNRQAFAVHADQCHACGACVAACPETAIRLVKAG
ncbi:MAG: ferredoxin family protein [Rhizomicrobium sp.]|jgi:NAD-dependent dihydropyrimidine dehydrogenase PreA subunit